MILWRSAVAAAFVVLSAASAFAGPALDAMQGRWSARGCADPGEWRVFGNEIEFQWPGRPLDIERVLSETGNRIETVGISPEINGYRYTYTVSADGNTVWIRNHRQNIDEVVTRCQ
jgi:hypothetical protein